MILFLFTAAIVSCNNDDREKEPGDTPPVITGKDDPKNVSGCYLRVIGRDTFAASLVQDGNMVSGKLLFDNFEKDGSSGTVSGAIEGDILKLVYRFRSEGMSSISEQFFKVTKEGLVQGIGDVGVKGDSAYYSDPANISYSEKDILKKSSCDEVKL